MPDKITFYLFKADKQARLFISFILEHFIFFSYPPYFLHLSLADIVLSCSLIYLYHITLYWPVRSYLQEGTRQKKCIPVPSTLTGTLSCRRPVYIYWGLIEGSQHCVYTSCAMCRSDMTLTLLFLYTYIQIYYTALEQKEQEHGVVYIW